MGLNALSGELNGNLNLGLSGYSSNLSSNFRDFMDGGKLALNNFSDPSRSVLEAGANLGGGSGLADISNAAQNQGFLASYLGAENAQALQGVGSIITSVASLYGSIGSINEARKNRKMQEQTNAQLNEQRKIENERYNKREAQIDNAQKKIGESAKVYENQFNRL